MIIDQIFNLLFLLPNAPLFITIAGNTWGFDLFSNDTLPNFFNLLLYIFLVVLLASAFHQIRSTRKTFFLFLFFGMFFEALAKLIDWAVNMSFAVNNPFPWNVYVDSTVEVIQLLGIISMVSGFFVLISKYAFRRA